MSKQKQLHGAWLVGIFLVLLAAAFRLDAFFVDLLAGPISSGQTKAVLRALRCWGEGSTLVILAAAMVFANRQRWREPIFLLISVLICAGTVDLVKPLFGRPRPDEVLRQEIPEDGWNSSFPSGHTATAFSFARGVSMLYPPLRPVCVFAASGTALSRMYDQRHFLSDCVAGGFLGWFLCGALMHAFRRHYAVGSRRSKRARQQPQPIPRAKQESASTKPETPLAEPSHAALRTVS